MAVVQFSSIFGDTKAINSDIPHRVQIKWKSKIAGNQQLKFTDKRMEGVKIQLQTKNENGHYVNGESAYLHFHYDGTVYCTNAEFKPILEQYGFNVVDKIRPKTTHEIREQMKNGK